MNVNKACGQHYHKSAGPYKMRSDGRNTSCMSLEGIVPGLLLSSLNIVRQRWWEERGAVNSASLLYRQTWKEPSRARAEMFWLNKKSLVTGLRKWCLTIVNKWPWPKLLTKNLSQNVQFYIKKNNVLYIKYIFKGMKYEPWRPLSSNVVSYTPFPKYTPHLAIQTTIFPQASIYHSIKR